MNYFNTEKKQDLPLRSLRLCGEKPQSGVAVIMVLGLLTVMTIMAVAFAVTMRTERLAAGNAVDILRARELVYVGLARAMNDLSTNLLGTNGLSGNNGKAYPEWNVTNSYTNIARWAIGVTNSSGEAANYIPQTLLPVVQAADALNSANHWLPVERVVLTNNHGTNVIVESNLMGRVAYTIVNCSGLLDANYVGGMDRAGGTNPAEIAITNLPDIAKQANLNFFLIGRNNSVRFENLAQLNVAMINDYAKQSSNLFVYSRGLPGYWNSGVQTQVNLAGTNINIRQVYITKALADAGFLDTDAYTIWHNLIDYVDTNHVWDSPYAVEPVPMINEIVVSNTLTVSKVPDGSYEHTITGAVYVECWYPFVSNSDVSFDVVSKAEFSGSMAPDTVGESHSTISSPVATGSFHIIRRDFGPKSFTKSSPCNVAFDSKITVSVEIGGGGVTVDKLEGTEGTASLTNTTIGIEGQTHFSMASAECRDPRFNYYITNTNLWRYNSWQDSMQTTLNEVNQFAKDDLNDASYNCDKDARMFIANRPLKSVAELGYLVYSTNSPWCTVKLYNPGLNAVLDKFGLQADPFVVIPASGIFAVPEGRNYQTGDPVILETTGHLPTPLSPDTVYYVIYESKNSFRLAATQADALARVSLTISSAGDSSVIIPIYVNAISRGTVNPNSRQVDALAAVFAQMPVDEYFGGPSNRLSMTSARTLAQRLIDGGYYTNLSDIGRGLINFDGLTNMGGSSISISSELQRESFFRNAIGLFNLRQNMFTIIIEAQAASGPGDTMPRNIPKNPAKQRAVVIVWRDPYTGEMFVRNIKWLGD